MTSSSATVRGRIPVTRTCTGSDGEGESEGDDGGDGGGSRSR